jgi:prevent-host-death family protein
MQVTTKELRIQPGRIIEQVSHGEEITITYRGKRIAKIVPIDESTAIDQFQKDSIFGLWENRTEEKTVDETVRDLRKGRQF